MTAVGFEPTPLRWTSNPKIVVSSPTGNPPAVLRLGPPQHAAFSCRVAQWLACWLISLDQNQALLFFLPLLQNGAHYGTSGNGRRYDTSGHGLRTKTFSCKCVGSFYSAVGSAWVS